ncbi:MAG TPA: MmcQ/YjbR family DNA-binding protein [Thermoanaerobaculia bacterium]
MTAKQIHERLRKRALRYPGATEDHPWGETAIKVKGKAFVFMGLTDGEVSISTKLPQSRDMAHDLPFAEPTHYGLGKHGWVTAHLNPKSKPPLELIEAWIDESYRAIAKR